MRRQIIIHQQILQLIEHPERISWPYVPDSMLQM